MPNREKVIKAAEDYEPYAMALTNLMINSNLFLNMLALLKEQESVMPIRINTNCEQSWKCGKCGGLVNTYFEYCPHCGQAVKWDG